MLLIGTHTNRHANEIIITYIYVILLIVILSGFIASTYKENLLDPADKPPSLIKTTFKLCEMI